MAEVRLKTEPNERLLGVLVGVVLASRRAGDEVIETIVQRQLWEDYGFRMAFDPPTAMNGRAQRQRKELRR
jgi:hypothetical protein